MSVGDVNSNARGTGARYNDGKPPVNLIPLSIIAGSFQAAAFPHDSVRGRVRRSLDMLGGFQETGDRDYLDCAIDEVRYYWTYCAEVFDYGRKKYAEWNWAKGMNWSVPLGCAGRHALRIFEGDLIDVESGLYHVGHYLANLVMLAHYVDNYPEGNDLPSPALFSAQDRAVFPSTDIEAIARRFMPNSSRGGTVPCVSSPCVTSAPSSPGG